MTREEIELKMLSDFFYMGVVVEAYGNMPGATGLAVKYGPNGFEKDAVITADTLDLLGRILSRYTKAYQQGVSKVEIVFFKLNDILLKGYYEPFTETDLEKYRL
jgi:hypothetical protein